MNFLDIKMTDAAKSYILNYFTEDELNANFNKLDCNPTRLLREVINPYFRKLQRQRKNNQLVIINKTTQGKLYYRLNNEKVNNVI